MAQNLISATLSAEDSAAVQQNLKEAKKRLSFLVNLQPSDVSSLLKMGNAYFPFIEKAYQVVIAHPEILPGVFDRDEFIRDYNLLLQIRPILNQINELAESIQKTNIAVGNDLMVGALNVYSAVKQNKDKVPGLAVTANELSEFFKKSKAKTKAKNN
jgi:hypothetical protein